MGISANQPTLYLGEIEFSPNSSPIASFSCHIPDDAPLSIIIQDEEGRSKYNEQLNLAKGEHNIEMDLSDFSNGNYNAWIDVLGKTFIRNIHIERNDSNSINLLRKITNFFG